MLRTAIVAISSVLLLLCWAAAADDKFVPDPLEPAPDGKVDCDWSKMKKDEYAACQDKKAFFAKMTPEEKEKYNKQVEKDRLEARVADLERRVEFLERTRR